MSTYLELYTHDSDWSYSAEGIEKLVGTIKNTTSKKMTVSSVRLWLGTLRGYVNSGTVFTGDGSAISTYVKLGGVKSGIKSVTTVVGTAGSGSNIFADTNGCAAYDFTLSSSLRLGVGETASLYISTPALLEGDTGAVLVMQRTTGGVYYDPVNDNVTITYNVNGGSGGPGSQTGEPPLTISSTRPTYESLKVTYISNGGSAVSPKTVSRPFVNWNTASNGSGTTYNPGSTYSGQTNITLYAQYNLNPKIGALPTPSYTNAIFLGWYTASTGGSKVTSSTTISSNITLYAHWQYRVTFRCNWPSPGGTIYNPETDEVGSELSYVKDLNVNFKIPKLTVSGTPDDNGEPSPYTWDGKWHENNTEFQNGGILKENRPYSLTTSQGSTGTFTVKWTDGYSGHVLKTMTVSYGTSIELSKFPPHPVREGYQFSGWFGNWTNITNDTVISAMWGTSKIWIYTKDAGWQYYKPKEAGN